jgi:hypothetical protein
MRLKCTCGGLIVLCPSCVQLKAMSPSQLKNEPPLIKTEEEIAREHLQQKRRRYRREV